MKYNRNSKKYRLAERIVHLTNALDEANKMLLREGKLGVLPDKSVDFYDSKTFHKKVRKVLNEEC